MFVIYTKSIIKVIVITHTLGLYLIYKCDAQGQSIYKSDTNWMDVLQLLCLWCVSGSKVPLCCWHKGEQLYITGPMPEWCKWCCWRKHLVSLTLNQNRFIMLIQVTLLVFQLSINIPLTLLTSYLPTLYAWSMLCIMDNDTWMILQHSTVRLSWSVV